MALVGICLALLVVAMAGTIVGFRERAKVRWTIAIVPLAVFLGGYAWHLLVLARYQPGGFLQYGWFETAPGRELRASIIHWPYFAATAAVFLFLVATTLRLRKEHKRWQTLALWLWSLALFGLFSAYFLLQLIQGDAAIFI